MKLGNEGVIGRLLLGSLAALSLVYGCASTSTTWHVELAEDEFTDTASCKVVYGSDSSRAFNQGLLGSGTFTMGVPVTLHYPFFQRVGDEVLFGVENVYGLFVGDVQIRVDDNPAVSISSMETPVYLSAAPATNVVDLSYLDGVEGVDREALEKQMSEAVNAVQAVGSPFTAAGGEKARLIIDQVQAGSNLKLRLIGTNQARSSTGEYALGANLNTALAACGI